MASERQIAANRRNAQKSTGPRSRGGKDRASRNAYRHGLSSSISSTAAFAKQLDQFARKIAGDSKDWAILQYARAAAEGELDLARARRAKVALIQRALGVGTLDIGAPARSAQKLSWFFKAVLRGEAALPESIDPAATMPAQEPERLAEAVRRVLPELVGLDRYERRASARRDRAILSMIESRKTSKNQS